MIYFGYSALIDQGLEFNPLLNESEILNQALIEREIGGLGIIMVKKIVDHIKYEYREKSNILKIFKKV